MKKMLPAAEEGDPQTQHNVGILYRNGQGTFQPTPDDLVEAARWFRRAADQGHADAQHKLGLMCARGEGLRRNLVQAHMWLSLAAAGRLGVNREASMRAREAVAATMTPGQIAKAERLARTWREMPEVTPEITIAETSTPEGQEPDAPEPCEAKAS